MNVKSLCLAILHDGEATGYEIRKLSTEGEYAYFVEASFGAIYPSLAKLEQDGLVTSRVEPQQGKPAKKVYAITEKGRQTFVDSLFEDLEDDVFRSEFLLFARFASSLPASLVRQRLDQRIANAESEMKRLRAMLDDHQHAGDVWVINYGLSCLKGAHDHLVAHKDDLIALAIQDESSSAAAE